MDSFYCFKASIFSAYFQLRSKTDSLKDDELYKLKIWVNFDTIEAVEREDDKESFLRDFKIGFVGEIRWIMMQRVVCLIFGRWRVVGDVCVILLKLSQPLLFFTFYFSPLCSSVLEPNLSWKEEAKEFKLVAIMSENFGMWKERINVWQIFSLAVNSIIINSLSHRIVLWYGVIILHLCAFEKLWKLLKW
jgi:hypothetical protein